MLTIGERRTVTIELVTDMLGTVPKNEKVYAEHIATKAADLKPDQIEEELSTVEDIEAKGWTGFHKDEEGLFIYGYMVKGFLKSALETMQTTGIVKKIPAYKKWVDRLLFIEPRRVRLGVMEADEVIERPLRTMTAKGERVALARSDTIKAGRKLTFDVVLLPNNKGLDWKVLSQCFEYGACVGLGQWRGSGGYGQFRVDSIVESGTGDGGVHVS